MIKFDPDIIDIDNEAALGKPKKRVKIYSDIFLTQKKSYFSYFAYATSSSHVMSEEDLELESELLRGAVRCGACSGAARRLGARVLRACIGSPGSGGCRLGARALRACIVLQGQLHLVPQVELVNACLTDDGFDDSSFPVRLK